MDSAKGLNCCASPKLDKLKTLYLANHDCEWLEQCTSCKAHWFHRFHEMMNFSDGDDDITEWYTLLTDNEAADIMDSQERPDLKYLEEKPSIMFDNSGISFVQGQPSYPWS